MRIVQVMALAGVLAGGWAAAGCASKCHGDPDTVCTIVGTGEAGLDRHEGTPALDSVVYLPQDITFLPDGNLVVVDWNNARIRELDMASDTVSTIAGTGISSDGPPGPALSSGLNHMTTVTFDGRGGLLIAAWHNSRVKRLDLSTNIIEFLCGDGLRAFAGDGGPAEKAELDLPVAVVVDSNGNVLIADQANNRIRMIDGSGIIDTVAGTGLGTGVDPVTMMPNPECLGASPTGTADCFIDGDLTVASLNNPRGQAAEPGGRLTIDVNDIIYIADTANNAIRRLDIAGNEMVTIAGLGPDEGGFSGDGGPAVEARLNRPSDLEIEPDGTLYIADTNNHCIRSIDPDGTIDTVAGVCGSTGELKDGDDRRATLFNRPFGLTMGPDGNLYVADTAHNVIRVVYLAPAP
ncbi:MAG TPA: hypothetical protein VG389_23960 [Myxococcota bacterium]|jgi:hypothetical protein|nr:hypothetical protein [Myxococcota bacterium]